MAASSLYRAVSRLLRCRSSPLSAVQRAVCTKFNVAQYPPPQLIHICLDQGVYTSSVSRHRCLATRAAAREVAAPLEDDGDDMDDEQEDFDEEFVAEKSVGRQIIVGNADWCSVASFLVLHAGLLSRTSCPAQKAVLSWTTQP
jgi:hypothetical protein